MSLRLSTLSTPDRFVHLRYNRLSPSGAPAPNSVRWSFTRVVFCSHRNACIYHDTADLRLVPLATAFDQIDSLKSELDCFVCTHDLVLTRQTVLIQPDHLEQLQSRPFNLIHRYATKTFLVASLRNIHVLHRDKERVSKPDPSLKSHTQFLHVLLQANSHILSTTPAAIFKQEEVKDFQNTPINPRYLWPADFP